jgi:hypothetical protein
MYVYFEDSQCHEPDPQITGLPVNEFRHRFYVGILFSKPLSLLV